MLRSACVGHTHPNKYHIHNRPNHPLLRAFRKFFHGLRRRRLFKGRGKEFYALAFSVFLIDQIIKVIVNKSMLVCQSIPIIPEVLHLTYIHNWGAAFGLFFGQRTVLIVIGIMVIMLMIYYHYLIGVHDPTQFALALILGGSVGNVTDRVLRGSVIDYVDCRVWPIFNLADVMINIGVLVIIFYLFKRKKRKRKSIRRYSR